MEYNTNKSVYSFSGILWFSFFHLLGASFCYALMSEYCSDSAFNPINHVSPIADASVGEHTFQILPCELEEKKEEYTNSCADCLNDDSSSFVKSAAVFLSHYFVLAVFQPRKYLLFHQLKISC